MADNQFSVRVPNVLEGLMAGEHGYKEVSGALKERAVGQAREEAAKDLMQGGNPQSALSRLIAVGDIAGAHTISQMTNSNRDFGLREKTFNENVRQFNVGADAGKTPPGFRKTATGGLEPVPGGPQDPTYIQETRKGPNMSVSDITKLSEEGGKNANLSGFLKSFEPRFAGATPGLGEVKNWVGRTMPEGMTSPDAREGAAWWQAYDKYKNTVRHDLFGSALTATEQAQWDRADIKNTMQPEQIVKNLQVQHDIIQKGMTRKASALVQAGHDPRTIGAAYGVPLESLGVPTKKNTPAPISAKNPPVKASTKQEYDALESGTTYIAPDGSLRTKK